MPTETMIAGIRHDRLESLRARETRRFAKSRPKAAAAAELAAAVWLEGVPLHWMKDWPMPHLP